MSTQDKLVEIRKLASRLQSASYDHADLCVWLMGEIDAIYAMVDKRYNSDWRA